VTGPLRLGVVGCGDVARYVALFARLSRGWRLAACCDALPERAARFARRFGIPRACSSYSELMALPDLDAVYLAVPHHLHAPLAAEAIRRGRPVLVEKPLARTLAEGLDLCRLAAEAGVKVGVNYQYRYDPGCYALARAAQAGALGPIHSARVNVPWHRAAAYFEHSPWHARLDQAGGGTLLTQGSHLLDIALWALGGRPVTALGRTARRVHTRVEVEDLAHGIVEMDSGALISISSSMVAASEQAVTVELYGAGATGFYSDRPWPRARFSGRRVAVERPPGGGLHPLQRCLEGFRRWLADDVPFLVPAPAALPVLAAVEAIYQSAQTGRQAPVAASMETL
jgi:predicted dehydrogenase